VKKRARKVPAGGSSVERRTSGLLRVPFVRRCALEFQAGRSERAFLVNINVMGAYVAAEDALPTLGEGLVCRFRLPGSEREVRVEAVVTWLNPRQQHPVHSLPPGFGLRFAGLSGEDQARIEALVRERWGRGQGAP